MILLREGSGGSAFDPFGREREKWSANDPFERGIWRECLRSFWGRERERDTHTHTHKSRLGQLIRLEP
jgi:hypothetical protein